MFGILQELVARGSHVMLRNSNQRFCNSLSYIRNKAHTLSYHISQYISMFEQLHIQRQVPRIVLRYLI